MLPIQYLLQMDCSLCFRIYGWYGFVVPLERDWLLVGRMDLSLSDTGNARVRCLDIVRDCVEIPVVTRFTSKTQKEILLVESIGKVPELGTFDFYFRKNLVHKLIGSLSHSHIGFFCACLIAL